MIKEIIITIQRVHCQLSNSQYSLEVCSRWQLYGITLQS